MRLPFRGGRYVATPGQAFTVMGGSRPVMPGAAVVLEARRGSGPWANMAVTTVAGGRYEATGLTLARGQTLTLRWAYLGGSFRRWLPAQSRTRTVTAS